jgi:hypothetical protein
VKGKGNKKKGKRFTQSGNRERKKGGGNVK